MEEVKEFKGKAPIAAAEKSEVKTAPYWFEDGKNRKNIRSCKTHFIILIV